MCVMLDCNGPPVAGISSNPPLGVRECGSCSGERTTLSAVAEVSLVSSQSSFKVCIDSPAAERPVRSLNLKRIEARCVEGLMLARSRYMHFVDIVLCSLDDSSDLRLMSQRCCKAVTPSKRASLVSSSPLHNRRKTQRIHRSKEVIPSANRCL